jgi:hypothetical protein
MTTTAEYALEMAQLESVSHFRQLWLNHAAVLMVEAFWLAVVHE